MGTGGYGSSAYALSFAEFGELLHLPRCDGWLLVRPIAGTHWRDASGLYPMFCCRDWRALADDLRELPPDIVAVTLVPDPFRPAGDEALQAFQLVRSYKERFIADLRELPSSFISRHHARAAKAALKVLRVEHCDAPGDHLAEWLTLYGATCRKHGVDGLRALTETAFREQLAMRDIVMFRALLDGRTVAIHLWIVAGAHAYGHLAGHSEEAYSTGAAYGLYWHALHWLHGRVLSVDLGSAAGNSQSSTGGLGFFKRGWSNQTLPGVLCGMVHNPAAYRALCGRDTPDIDTYFPAYAAAGS